MSILNHNTNAQNTIIRTVISATHLTMTFRDGQIVEIHAHSVQDTSTLGTTVSCRTYGCNWKSEVKALYLVESYETIDTYVGGQVMSYEYLNDECGNPLTQEEAEELLSACGDKYDELLNGSLVKAGSRKNQTVHASVVLDDGVLEGRQVTSSKNCLKNKGGKSYNKAVSSKKEIIFNGGYPTKSSVKYIKEQCALNGMKMPKLWWSTPSEVLALVA